jgi:sigma-E factor negative regulatory protein RseA
MSEKLNEQLSALVDGELPGAEKEMLLTRLARDPELKRKWRTYHMISASLRNQLPEHTDQNLAERVGGMLEQEPPILAATAAGASRWPRVFKPLAGLAIAASVAVVAVLTMQQLRPSSTTDSTAIVASGPVSDPAGGYTRVDSGQRHAGSPTPDYLNQYLVNHNEYAASSGIRGMLPYVRIVGSDNGR